MPLLSVIVPVHNEAKTIRQILRKIGEVPLDKEVVVVDDASLDGTAEALQEMSCPGVKVIRHETNQGKGAAFLTGLAHSSGEYVIVQDADLEYDPQDYPRLMDAIRTRRADIVLGARFKEGHRGLFAHRMGNRVLTGFLNLLFGARLNDYATCYKLARRDTFTALGLRAAGFDIDVEMVCNALKKKYALVEIPISYFPRTYREGKKIRLKDAFWAFYYMIQYRLSGYAHT